MIVLDNKESIEDYFVRYIHPNYSVEEDHWEFPGYKFVDVNDEIYSWIEQQDRELWQYFVDVPGYIRVLMRPELLTILQLKFPSK